MHRFQAVLGVPSIMSGVPATLRVPLLFDPGERWCDGIGIDWVGKATKAVCDWTLGVVLKERVTIAWAAR